jgi:capsular polysaccharide biosynthesis protein
VSTAESDIQNNQSLYNTLVTKLKEAEMTSQQSGPQVQVVEPAAADQIPVRPRKLLNLLVCVFAGLVVGTGLAYLREYLRRTIRTPQDVDEYLQLPVLGLIPKA